MEINNMMNADLRCIPAYIITLMYTKNIIILLLSYLSIIHISKYRKYQQIRTGYSYVVYNIMICTRNRLLLKKKVKIII